MKIAVLIKQVPMGEVHVDPDTHALIRQSGESMVNPADLNAIEMAMQLKENTQCSVTVFTMGPPEAEKALRTALAMGCDEACLISDRAFGGADTIATSRVLSAAVQHIGGFSLVLAGAQSSDGATGQVGPMVAHYMDLPHITEVQTLILTENGAEVTKKCGCQKVRLGLPLPALCTVNFGANSPRLTTLRSQRAAKTKEILTLSNSVLSLSENTVGLAGSPTIVVDSYQPETARQAVFLSGSDQDIARQLMELVAKAKGGV